MALTKDEIVDKMKEMFFLLHDLEEALVKKDAKKFYREAMQAFGDWEKALRASSITKRKLKEREKFRVYSILKARFEEHGEEALRPKNVMPEDFKERVVASFKTLKAVRDLIKGWSEEKVIYELHESLLCGLDIDEMEEQKPELYEQILDHFSNVDQALEQYDKRFGLPHIDPLAARGRAPAEDDDDEETLGFSELPRETVPAAAAPREVVQTPAAVETEDEKLVATLIALGYVTREQVEQARKTTEIPREEVATYLFTKLISGEKFTEETINKENPSMYIGLKLHFKSLEAALDQVRQAISKSFGQAM